MADSTSGARPARAGAAAKKAPSSTGATKRAAATKKAAPAQAPAEAPTPTSVLTPSERRTLEASGSTWSLAYKVTAAVLVFAAFVLLLRMYDQDRNGPAHTDLSIGDGVPATVYLPVDALDDGDFPTQAAPGHRPPVVVMAHGYSADRASMSGMARSLAKAGYAVLSIDFRGHGANTHPFRGDLRDDLSAAVDWATTSPYVDGKRIAVLGHSMGASAALDFATVDNRAKAVIPVSGGGQVNDAVVPAHTLFLVGSGDPDEIADRQVELAKVLKAEGGSVTSHEVHGADHIQILRKSDTIAAITTFLDPILDVHRAGPTPGLVDPRFATAGLYLLVALGLIALLGLAVGQTVPAPANGASPRSRPSGRGFAVVTATVVVLMPLLTVGGFDLLPLGAGQPIVMLFALAGAALWGGRALAQRGQLGGATGALLAEGQWLPFRTVVWPGLASAGVIVALLLPLAPVFHRMVPTPARGVYWLLLSAAALPFFAAFEALTRRGRGASATLAGIGGKLLLLLVIYVGALVGLLPFVILLLATVLALQYVLLEVFAATAFARGRNTALIAVVEAVLVAFAVVTLTPVG
jgi:dienelactone hydrolase